MVRLAPLAIAAALALQLTGCGTAATAFTPVFAQSFQAQGTATDGILSMPRFTQTARGQQGDAVNLVLVASEATMTDAFAQAGWLPADPIAVGSVARMAQTGLFAGHYPTAPMSALYLFGRIQDMSYQKNAVGIIARDHLRVWRTPMQDAQGRTYWAVAATKDVAVKFAHGLPTHRIAPEIDEERQLVVDDVKATGRVVRHSMVQALPPGYRGHNGEDDPYVTDGQVAVLELADALLPQ